jgi:BirA family transcriptional regulator, biotin operon repressor / biotin---[acetyl-CoA-carboxylase] ligase
MPANTPPNTPPTTPSIHFYDTVASTQDLARALARAGSPTWTAVVAQNQTQGRGRQGKSWQSALNSGLYCTVIVVPQQAREQWGLWSLLAGVALAQCINNLGLNTKLKWPNDLLAPTGQKLAGILLEHDAESGVLLLGIGVNVLAQDFTATINAAALADFGLAVTAKDLFNQLYRRLVELNAQWQQLGAGFVLEQWRLVNTTLGREVTITGAGGESFSGVASSIDETGALVVKTNDGWRTVTAGEVSLRF